MKTKGKISDKELLEEQKEYYSRNENQVRNRNKLDEKDFRLYLERYQIYYIIK